MDDGQTERTTREWRDAVLVEVEQGAPYSEEMKKRLASYARYYGADRPRVDYGTLPCIAVLLKDDDMVARFLAAQRAAQLTGLHVETTIPDWLAGDPLGPFGAVWRTPRNLDVKCHYLQWHEVEKE